MVLILTSGDAVRSPVRGKTATLRDGTKVTGDVVAARPGRFPDSATWFLDETIRDAEGREHRCRLLSDSVRAFMPGRRLPSDKPFMIRFRDEAQAKMAAEAIGRVASAYAEGRLAVHRLAESAEEASFQVAVEGGVEEPKAYGSELEAVAAAEDLAAASPDARVTVTEVAGVIPTVPLGRFVDFDAVKAWSKESLRVGMVLVLEETHGGIIRYMPARVASLPDKGGRFSVDLPKGSYAAMYGDPRFYVSGKFYRAPTGQSRLLPPIREALDLAARGGTWSGSGKHLEGSGRDKVTDEEREALASQDPVPWTLRRPAPRGLAMLAVALERATEHPAEKTVRKLATRGLKARTAVVKEAPAEAVAEPEAPDAEPPARVVIQVLSLAQLRGAPKQVHWAQSILTAFRKARGLDKTGAVPTPDDEVVLGCATASLLIDHRELLKDRDPAAFVEAIGARWVEFDGIDAYRGTPVEMGKKSALAWHWHTVTVAGQEYSFEAVGHEQWMHKGDSGRFAWREVGGKRRILEGTLRTVSKGGEALVRGNRASKPQGRR